MAKYTFKDFKSDQEVRWCPGCGDYSVKKKALTRKKWWSFPVSDAPHDSLII